ncbi:hypothetical protein JVU11DRAFT_11565 [Chiua virens]|nr:hypothetical protein JVU11DRAFT_11565 [Chiua virens]
MQPAPNRLGLGLRPPLPSYGQGPSISALAQQQQMMQPPFMPPQKQTTLFVGSISGGITDAFLNQMLSACGPVKSFKRLITPANKPQGFGFAEYEDPDSAIRCLALLQGVELPALEDGCANKKLLIKADEKTKLFLDAYSAQKMKTDADEAMMQQARAEVNEFVEEINRTSQDAANDAFWTKRNTSYLLTFTIFTKLIFQKPNAVSSSRRLPNSVNAPRNVNERSGPKSRDWGSTGKGPQGYGKPVGFVKAEDAGAATGPLDDRSKGPKTDEEMERERKDARRRDEEVSFEDRERRYEPRERARIAALERSIARQNAIKEAEERDRVEMYANRMVFV